MRMMQRAALHQLTSLRQDLQHLTRGARLHLDRGVRLDRARRLRRDDDVALLHRQCLVDWLGRRLAAGSGQEHDGKETDTHQLVLSVWKSRSTRPSFRWIWRLGVHGNVMFVRDEDDGLALGVKLLGTGP